MIAGIAYAALIVGAASAAAAANSSELQQVSAECVPAAPSWLVPEGGLWGINTDLSISGFGAAAQPVPHLVGTARWLSIGMNGTAIVLFNFPPVESATPAPINSTPPVDSLQLNRSSLSPPRDPAQHSEFLWDALAGELQQGSAVCNPAAPSWLVPEQGLWRINNGLSISGFGATTQPIPQFVETAHWLSAGSNGPAVGLFEIPPVESTTAASDLFDPTPMTANPPGFSQGLLPQPPLGSFTITNDPPTTIGSGYPGRQ